MAAEGLDVASSVGEYYSAGGAVGTGAVLYAEAVEWAASVVL